MEDKKKLWSYPTLKETKLDIKPDYYMKFQIGSWSGKKILVEKCKI